MLTLRELIAKSTQYLTEKGVSNPRKEAGELIAHCLQCSRLDLYMDIDRPLEESELEQCRHFLKRRGQREPLAYMVGEMEFFHCRLDVSPHVLIPRQETEILVDKIVKEENLEEKILWDLCTGSGAIGISLKKAVPSLQVVLSDISDKALEVAQNNARKNEVEVQFLLGDLFAPFQGLKTDFIVCNPPYISEEEYAHLEPEVRLFEPRGALVAQEGLEFYRRLALEAPNYLQPEGVLWLEIGAGQGEELHKIFASWKQCTIEKDWSGHDRFVRAKR